MAFGSPRVDRHRTFHRVDSPSAFLNLSLTCTVRRLLHDLVPLVRLSLTSRAQLAAEDLSLRKQLALYQEHHKTRPTTRSHR